MSNGKSSRNKATPANAIPSVACTGWLAYPTEPCGQLFPRKIDTTKPTAPLLFFHFNVFIYFLPTVHVTHITEPLLYVYYIHKWCGRLCYKYVCINKYILPFLAAGSLSDENRLTISTWCFLGVVCFLPSLSTLCSFSFFFSSSSLSDCSNCNFLLTSSTFSFSFFYLFLASISLSSSFECMNILHWCHISSCFYFSFCSFSANSCSILFLCFS